jgi:DNA-binding XRE family transcriptional regulator
MTQRDMAGYIDVTPVTLRNWRKNKPHLYEIIMKGFAFIT